MKFFLVSILLAVAVTYSNAAGALTSNIQDAIRQKFAQVCIAETGVDKEIAMNIKKGQFADDPKLAPFVLCMYKKVGFQNEAGEIQESVIREQLTEQVGADAAEKLIRKCLIKKATPEITALDMFKCYYVNTPDNLHLV